MRGTSSPIELEAASENGRSRVPGWIRAVMRADRGVRRIQRLVSMVAEETVLAWVAPAHRHLVTFAVYDGERTYVPGGARFKAGLFRWEQEAITSGIFPGRGRILLGGAGGGREMLGLTELGYRVVAFEPADALVRGALALCKDTNTCQIVRADYADLVRASRGEASPLAQALQTPFDGIILGWGSFSHVLDAAERLDVLRALRSVAPAAPVLVSYLRRSSSDVDRPRALLRKWFARLGCRYRAVPGDGFMPWAGFYYAMTTDELSSVADAAGYAIALSEVQPYAHAILTPK